MRKIIFLTIGLTVITGILLVAWPHTGRSKGILNYEKPASCHDVIINGIGVLANGYTKQIQSISEQGKPASMMADDMFEAFRTYRCWLDYLCLTVRFSGKADPILSGVVLTSDALGRVAGCLPAEELEFPETWPDFLMALSVNPNYIDPPAPKFTYLPQCAQHDPKDVTSQLNIAEVQFDDCRKEVNRAVFNMPADATGADAAFPSADMIMRQSSAFSVIQASLMRAAAEKKIYPVEKKMAEIAGRLAGMVEHTERMKLIILHVFKRVNCYLSTCT